MKAAAENLERFDAEHTDKLRDSNIQPLMLTSLTYLTLEELASLQAKCRLQENLYKFIEEEEEGRVKGKTANNLTFKV